MILELSRKGHIVVGGYIELEDAIGLQVHGDHLEVQIASHEVEEQLHIAWDVN
jgi:hypothetical protein